METCDPSPKEQAVLWAIRARADSFDDWEELADWLAADPHNAELYDRATIAAEEGAAASRVVVPLPDNDASPTVASRGSRTFWLASALAASIVAAVGGLLAVRELSAPDLYEIATHAGESRDVRVGGTVRIMLNGATRLTLDHRNDRFARLDAGEALFTVAHDAKNPFRLSVGDTTVTDVGTVFNVERDAGVATVSVAEGAVRIDRGDDRVEASAGQAVTVDTAAARLVRQDRNPALVGAWREGRVDFADTSLAQLADRIHRRSGIAIMVSENIRDRRASGSIEVGHDPEVLARKLERMLGITVTRRGGAWIWDRRPDAGSA